jgi:hypothetical protein
LLKDLRSFFIVPSPGCSQAWLFELASSYWCVKSFYQAHQNCQKPRFN